MHIPNLIISCEELIDKLIDMSACSLGSIPPTQSLKTEIFNGITMVESVIIKFVTDILIEFPLLNELEPYIADEIDILIDRSKYFYYLGEINRTVKDVEFIIDNYNILFQNTVDHSVLKSLFKTVLGRICFTLRSKSKAINFLNHSIQAFHSIPVIQDNLSTCIIVGNNTDDLFFSIIMDDANINNTTNNNTNKKEKKKVEKISYRYTVDDDSIDFNNIQDIPYSSDEDDDQDDEEFNEDEDEEYEDDSHFKSQQAIIRSYKFNDKIDYNRNEEYSDKDSIFETTSVNEINGNLKPFSVGVVGKFQIIETPSLSMITKTANSNILLNMIKVMLKNTNTLILFNFDFNVLNINEIDEQINYYISIKPFISNQIILIFSNCKSSKDSFDFIEFFKNKLQSNQNNNNNNNNIEIPPIFIYEQHVNQIKEYISKFNNFPISPFKRNNLDNMFSTLTMDQQNQMMMRNNQSQQQQDVDQDILDKINKLCLN